MLQRVRVSVFLVGALTPGEDLAPGAVVEVGDLVARDWIAKGWAVAANAADESEDAITMEFR